MSRPRHSRQVRLAEIGEAGQARIEATTAHVSTEGLAGALEVRYLAGAGVRKIATANELIAQAARAVDPTVEIVSPSKAPLGVGEPPIFGARDPVAAEAALGAWRALAHLRRAAIRRESEA